MADKAAAGLFVVSRNAAALHIFAQRLRRSVGLALYKKALLALDDLVRAGAVKAHSPVLRHRVLRLVAVTQRIRGTKDFLHHDSAAADAREIVLHALLFEAQLLFVAHVAIGAAAAAWEVRAVRFNART